MCPRDPTDHTQCSDPPRPRHRVLEMLYPGMKVIDGAGLTLLLLITTPICSVVSGFNQKDRGRMGRGYPWGRRAGRRGQRGEENRERDTEPVAGPWIQGSLLVPQLREEEGKGPGGKMQPSVHYSCSEQLGRGVCVTHSHA